MITNENWVEFIQKFFHVEAPTEWVLHVAGGWNHVKQEAGCNCSFTWYSGPVECENYKDVQAAKLEFSNVDSKIDVNLVDVEGVANYLQRDDDTIIATIIEPNSSTGSNFFENDEPVAEIVASFNSGPKGLTSKPNKDEDEDELQKDWEEDGPGHGFYD